MKRLNSIFLFSLYVLVSLGSSAAAEPTANKEVDQKIIFCAESIKYARDTGQKECDAKCGTCNINYLQSSGWRIASAFQKEVIKVDWKTKHEGYEKTVREYCVQDHMQRSITPIDCPELKIYNLGCTCIGTQYIMEKTNTKQASTENAGTTASNGQEKMKRKYVSPLSGVTVQNITPKLRSKFDIPKNREKVIIVTNIERKSPAVVDLVNGDVILEINGKPVADIDDYQRAVSNVTPGESVQLLVLRSGSALIYKMLSPRSED